MMKFPPAVVGPGGASYAVTVLNTTGFVLILPYLDQAPLYNKYNFSSPSTTFDINGAGAIPTGTTSSTNMHVYSQKIPVYICPSDPLGGENYSNAIGTSGYYETNNASRSNYMFNTGAYYEAAPTWAGLTMTNRGVFGNDGAANIKDITDGASNTICLLETPQKKTSVNYGPFWGIGGHTSVQALINSNAWNMINAPGHLAYPQYGPGQPGYDPAYLRPYAWVAGSEHEGGCHALLTDGSVRFLSENMSFANYRSLNYIADGAIVGEF